MPSPIAHLAAGYVLARLVPRLVQPGGSEPQNKALVLGFAAFMSLLPDFDFVPGVLLGDPGRFHNSYSHSLFVVLPVALLFGWLASVGAHWPFKMAFWVALAGYGLHVVFDYFTVGRGVMLFWPLTPQRYSPPVQIFYGVRWTDGFISARHLWTVLNEVLFVAVLFAVFNRWPRSGRRATT